MFLVSLTVRAAYFEQYFAISSPTHLRILAVVWLLFLAVFQTHISRVPRRKCVYNISVL